MPNVWVTNTDDHDLQTRWHGRSYLFKIGEPVEIEYDVAQNIFGHDMPNKFEFLVRLGWTYSSTDMPQALERLERFKISADRPDSPRVPSPAAGTIPLPVTRRGR
jgi:hypothetical protein